MTESMIERVARTLALYEEHDDWEGLTDRSKEFFMCMARAAIEAMREPTYIMCLMDGISEKRAKHIWQAMIDEALK